MIFQLLSHSGSAHASGERQLDLLLCSAPTEMHDIPAHRGSIQKVRIPFCVRLVISGPLLFIVCNCSFPPCGQNTKSHTAARILAFRKEWGSVCLAKLLFVLSVVKDGANRPLCAVVASQM